MNERLRRLKASTVALTVAAAISLWWLVGGAVAAAQADSPAGANGNSIGTSSAPDTQGQFFANQQPTLGNSGGSVPILHSAGS